jgi:enoyl-CoA hydratase/carnithine racemase
MTLQQPTHFRWDVAGKVATITLDRPEKKNPLTFESYAELRDTFRALAHEPTVKAVVITGAGGNFCSGGDVFEIIGPLTQMKMPELLAFTRMTGDVVKAMRLCPQPVIAAVEGVCAGAGAILAMAADFNALHLPGHVLAAAQATAASLADGPTFAHAITKSMLHREWNMDVEGAIDAEAQAQAICMATGDFRRAYEAFADKRRPEFRGD